MRYILLIGLCLFLASAYAFDLKGLIGGALEGAGKELTKKKGGNEKKSSDEGGESTSSKNSDEQDDDNDDENEE
ncbi:MAG: hypothetical protein ACTSXG_02565 [Alphaproteobacteria bacterium]